MILVPPPRHHLPGHRSLVGLATATILAAMLAVGALAPGAALAQSGGAAPAAAPTPLPLADSDLLLRPGDQLRVTVWRKPELSGDFTVGTDGRLRHPIYRQVPVAGVPLNQVVPQLGAVIAQFETAPFEVQPLIRIIVAGEVQSPNVYTVPPEVTVLDAVMLAGGPGDRARRDRLRLVRNDGSEHMLDLDRADPHNAQLRVRSGDQLTLTRRGSAISDVVLPVSGVIAAIGTIVNVVLILRDR